MAIRFTKKGQQETRSSLPRLKRVIRSLLLTLLQAEGVHIAVVRADIHHAIRHGG